MNIASLILYCFIVTFSPGPTNIVILSTTHNFGTKKAMQYTYGATVAFGILLLLSVLLNSLLVTIIPKILVVMQLIGSLYMLYLAYQVYKMDVSKPMDNQTGSFWSGFAMQFINPKVVLFTMTVIPSFVMPYYTDMSALMISVILITIIGFLAFLTWVLFGTLFRDFLQKHKKAVNVAMALFLVYAAVIINK
ncbi:LysE family translocator [Trichococcus pasteurii]|uniref:Lysine-type exporter protein (Lyse/ygga) n=1 Tax=Trichococcus pasteurii TaxID=43064 RepID=A0A1W1ICH5_9LACT|nr:LysE family transporter [Trichococcus pasteurii]SFE28116.1 Threonine/homoserine/homoserine lactone efflux protein [Trichococcus pasteurii]SLM50569.1 lysine-type exporter protein (lyse/ygga) [Trichococcus pasteurii]SSB91450.1 lysine-type exporter protein (lyse/ygga) [Trichococcus pasteurii]